MTDMDRQNTVLEKEIETAIKDIARKKAVLSSFEQAALAKDTRRRRLWWAWRFCMYSFRQRQRFHLLMLGHV